MLELLRGNAKLTELKVGERGREAFSLLQNLARNSSLRSFSLTGAWTLDTVNV